jgi:hypothetical protein
MLTFSGAALNLLDLVFSDRKFYYTNTCDCGHVRFICSSNTTAIPTFCPTYVLRTSEKEQKDIEKGKSTLMMSPPTLPTNPYVDVITCGPWYGTEVR